MTSGRPTSVLAALVLVLAACGGGGGGGGVGRTSAVPAQGAATSGATQATASGAPAELADGGGTAAGVCEFATADELSRILNVPSVTMTVVTGPPDNCIVDGADASSLAAWSLTVLDKDLYKVLSSGPEVRNEPGLGDAVMYQPEAFQMTVFKGDSMLVIGVYASAGSDEERLEFMKEIGATAAGRM